MGSAVRREDHGPTYFGRTTDGGSTWEAPQPIYDPGATSQTINNQTVVLTDGTLVTFFTQFDDAGGGQRNGDTRRHSLDRQGRRRGRVASSSRPCSRSARVIRRTARSCAMARTSARSPPACTTILSSYGRMRASPAVRATASRCRARPTAASRGRRPARINRDPSVRRIRARRHRARRRHDRRDLFRLPQQHGEFRPPCRPTTGSPARATASRWRESRVAGPFDLAPAPLSEGLFLGDYQALVAIGDLFVPFYATRTAPSRAIRPTSSTRS